MVSSQLQELRRTERHVLQDVEGLLIYVKIFGAVINKSTLTVSWMCVSVLLKEVVRQLQYKTV